MLSESPASKASRHSQANLKNAAKKKKKNIYIYICIIYNIYIYIYIVKNNIVKTELGSLTSTTFANYIKCTRPNFLSPTV